MRIYAIGDVHGRLDLLERLYTLIDKDLSTRPVGDFRLIHLGDYIDRGSDSAGVIQTLVDLTSADKRILAIAGNHDSAFLEFMVNPDCNNLFARFGGVETAISYGIAADFTTQQLAIRSRDGLAKVVPWSHFDFLAALPYSVSFGDYFFCHAGIRPSVDLDAQTPDDLAWIRQDFLRHTGLYAKVIVHGHTPGDSVAMFANRVNVDTGAYFSGRLSAVVLEGAEKRVIEAVGSER